MWFLWSVAYSLEEKTDVQNKLGNRSFHENVQSFLVVWLWAIHLPSSVSRSSFRKSGCGYVEKGMLLHCRWECKLVQPLWRTVWMFVKKLKLELPFQYSCLESSMDRGAWRATVCGVTKTQTQLSTLTHMGSWNRTSRQSRNWFLGCVTP